MFISPIIKTSLVSLDVIFWRSDIVWGKCLNLHEDVLGLYIVPTKMFLSFNKILVTNDSKICFYEY